jgi:hypothetical protein
MYGICLAIDLYRRVDLGRTIKDPDRPTECVHINQLGSLGPGVKGFRDIPAASRMLVYNKTKTIRGTHAGT